MVEMKIIDTILIGLGNVGARYDLKNDHRTSHIKSLSGIKNYNLNLVIDINKKNEAIAKKYKVHYLSSIKSLNKYEIKNSLIVLAIPTVDHLKVFKFLSKLGIKKILFEKPIGKNLFETQKIIEICKKKKIRIYTNYFRRNLRIFLQIRKVLKKKKIGETISGKFEYDKYILNNGCHAIDLLNFFFDDKCNFKVTKIIKRVKENSGYLIDFIISNNKANFFFKCNSNLKIRNLKFAIYGTKGMITFDQAKGSTSNIIFYDKKIKITKKSNYEFENRQHIVYKNIFKTVVKHRMQKNDYYKNLLFPQKIMSELIEKKL